MKHSFATPVMRRSLFAFRFDASHIKNGWIPAAILFTTSGTVGLILAVYSNILRGGTALSLGTIVFSLALAVVWLVFLRILQILERHMEEDQKTALLKQQMAMQIQSMEALENNYRLQRKMTHEFQHHLQTLQTLLAGDQTAAAVAYLRQLQHDRALRTISVYSRHPIIDTILNQKHQLAQEHRTKMQIRVNDLSGLTLPTDLLVVIFTNLLDNALEACGRLEGYREIHCTILLDDGLFLSIRNTSPSVTITDGMMADGTIPTSKTPPQEHGFGLLNVGYALEQLDAEYTFDYQDGWFQFVAEIPIL